LADKLAPTRNRGGRGEVELLSREIRRKRERVNAQRRMRGQPSILEGGGDVGMLREAYGVGVKRTIAGQYQKYLNIEHRGCKGVAHAHDSALEGRLG